ncbi:MAG: two pore domain potassium channel family protein [Gemmatimonadetes bacterium]|nr:two pore domain potassium channel family protein [Gemmatimonadota bacterium]
MQDWLEPLAGGIVLAITLLDVFLTVLYARAGTGLLAPRLARGVWRVFRGLSGGRHAGILSYCGPVQLVVLVLTWSLLLALGSGLVIHPALGTGVESSSGATDTDFVTALLVGGSSMSIVGASDYGPTSPGYKLLFLFNSLVGMSVTSLTLTYLMQVYTALRSRNVLGLMVQTQSGETGDAAELLARWGPRGRFDGGYNNLSTLAGEVAAIKETHHFYPVLFYFRFEEAFYAPSRILLVALDAAALVRTALDPRELGWLQESAALAELERSSALLLRTLDQNFPTPHGPSANGTQSRERWRLRYERALLRLREAGIPTREDPEAGAREYVEMRARWEPGIEAVAPALGYRMEEVDTAGYGAHARAAGG